MLIPQGLMVKRSEFEVLQQKVSELEKRIAELIAKAQPEPRKYVRRDHG